MYFLFLKKRKLARTKYNKTPTINWLFLIKNISSIENTNIVTGKKKPTLFRHNI